MTGRDRILVPFRRRTDRTVPRRTGIPPYAPPPGPVLGLIGGTDVDACCAPARCRCACGCRAHSHYRRCRPCAQGAHAGPPAVWPISIATGAGLAFGDWPPLAAPRLRHPLAVAS